MARDALHLLSSIRQRSIDQAHQALTFCLKAEADILHKIKLLDEAARRDHLTAQDSPERAQFLDMFATRLSQAQIERRTLRLNLTAAEARSADARAALAAARREAEAVDTLIQDHAAAKAALLEKQAQHALDDIARTRHAQNRHDGKP